MNSIERPSVIDSWSANDLRVGPFQPPPVSTEPTIHWDLFVAACGFESRASFVHRNFGVLARRTAVAGFESRRELSFDDNREYFSNVAEVASPSDREYGDWIQEHMRAAVSESEQTPYLVVDISSLSRMRLAAIVEILATIEWGRAVTVAFAYAPGRLKSPWPQGDIAVCQPVTPFFSGFSLFPGRPPTAIVGLGYEVDRALGIVEYLEAEDVIAMRPSGLGGRFNTTVEKANEKLLLRPNQEAQIIDYNVLDPFGLFVLVESMVHGLQMRRPTIIPMGPKIFALASLVAVAIHLPNAAVWRVSGGDEEPAGEREAMGPVVGLEVTVQPRDPSF